MKLGKLEILMKDIFSKKGAVILLKDVFNKIRGRKICRWLTAVFFVSSVEVRQLIFWLCYSMRKIGGGYVSVNAPTRKRTFTLRIFQHNSACLYSKNFAYICAEHNGSASEKSGAFFCIFQLIQI